ncbi:MAG: IPT/TIG domain-containing protein, partial [Acidobacteriaceae bacterium]
GGVGGPGGQGGQIVIISTPQNLASSGVFRNTQNFTYVTTSLGGKAGDGAHGGAGGDGGEPGARSSSCASGTKGTAGPSQLSVDGPNGTAGAPGGAPSPNPEFEALSSGACADPISTPLKWSASNTLTTIFRRCSSGGATGSLSLAGQYLDQIASVTCSLSGVTVAIDSTSTSTLLKLNLAIAANSASGLGDLIFTFFFPPAPTQTLAGAVQVNVCAVTSIAPATGAQGATVAVTLTGIAFDPAGATHTVSVSGTDVTVTPGSVAVVNDQTITCQLVIGTTAAKTSRDIVLTAGTASSPCQSTLSASFMVT